MSAQNTNFIVSNAYDGMTRRLFESVCTVCLGVFLVPKHVLGHKKTCSIKCRGVTMQTRVVIQCVLCGKHALKSPSSLKVSRSGLWFCSRVCKDRAQRLEGIPEIQPAHYGDGAYSKALIIRQRGHKCQNCQLSSWLGQPIALEVDHVDGNSDNSSGDNLKLLCPNCHAQTPTYRGRNRGHGRKSRRRNGVLAHSGERRDGIAEVAGAEPADSTKSGP